MKPRCWNTCRMWLCVVLLKSAGTSLKETSSGCQHMLLQNPNESKQVTPAMGTNTPADHHRIWLANVVLVTVWITWRTQSPKFPPPKKKKNLKCGLVRWQITVPHCVSPPHMSLGPEKSTAFLDVINIWLSLCIVESDPAFVDAATNCLLTIVFWSVLHTVMLVFNAVSPEGSKVTGIQCWFSVKTLNSF